MFEYSAGAAFLFKCTNVAVLWYLGFRLFKRYGAPSLRTAREQQEQQQQESRNDIGLLQQNHTVLTKQIASDRVIAARLQKEVDTWATTLAQERARNLDQKREYLHQMEQRVLQRQQQLNLIVARRVIAARAIGQVEQQAKVQFSDTHVRQRYLTAVLMRMRAG